MLIVAFLALPSVLLGCRAGETTKQGIEGEFCNNRDDDCRDGHICEEGVCRAIDGPAGSVTCAEMCSHLEECQAGEENCEADCRATIRGTCDGLPCPWSDEAVDSFGNCVLGLSCEETREVDAPQTCYRRIEISADRENRCEAFIAAVGRCNGSASTSELRNRCFLLGRTNTDTSWSRTDACVDRVDDGLCNEIETCFNEVFELDPSLDLGDGQIGGASPGEPMNNPVDRDDI